MSIKLAFIPTSFKDEELGEKKKIRLLSTAVAAVTSIFANDCHHHHHQQQQQRSIRNTCQKRVKQRGREKDSNIASFAFFFSVNRQMCVIISVILHLDRINDNLLT